MTDLQARSLPAHPAPSASGWGVLATTAPLSPLHLSRLLSLLAQASHGVFHVTLRYRPSWTESVGTISPSERFYFLMWHWTLPTGNELEQEVLWALLSLEVKPEARKTGRLNSSAGIP